MADQPRYPGTPRWVKVSVIIVGVLVLLVVGLMVFGGGKHGPGRHMPGAGTSPSGVTGDRTPPGGGLTPGLAT